MANLTRRPEQGFVSLRDAMDQLFAEAFTPLHGRATAGQGGGDSMPINVYEDGERYYLQALLPAVDPQGVEMTAANGVLSIHARQQPASQDGWRPVWQEFAPTEYRRQLRLPGDIDANKIEATYQNGVLMITAPKAEHTRPKQIKVQVGS
jgi:HSP20 family protein